MSYSAELLIELDQAVAGGCKDGEVAMLFSGGLDSGVLAALARRHARPRLYTVGIEGAYDLRASEEAAAALDLPWTPLVMSEEEILDGIVELLSIEGLISPITVSFELPLQMVASRAREGTLMSGQGADELFGGYSRYLEMGEAELEDSLRRDLSTVLGEGAPRERRIASHYGKEIVHPFLAPGVLSAAERIPVGEKIRNGVRKAVLRDVAADLEMGFLAAREKKAAQYGSGFMKVLKSTARKRGLSVTELVAELGARGQQS